MEYIVKTIDRRVYNTSQDQRYDHYFKYEDKNLSCRIYIRSGQTKSDGQAQIMVLDPNSYEWKLVYFIPYSEMNTEQGLGYSNKQKSISYFRRDEMQLMDKLEELL